MPGGQLPERLRLFVALVVPELMKEAIARAQSELQRAVVAGQVRWTTLDQFHLTLRFLGSVDTARLTELQQALDNTAKRFPPLQLRAAGIGCFPSLRSPRVVWAGVRDAADRLKPLQRAVQEATLPFTAEPPENRFSGHVTLARIKRIARPDIEALAKAAARFEESSFGDWRAAELHLIRSELSPKGARYTSFAEFAFER